MNGYELKEKNLVSTCKDFFVLICYELLFILLNGLKLFQMVSTNSDFELFSLE